MYVIRRFRHAIEKGTSTGEAVRIVADTLMEAQHGEVVFHAYFSDFKHRKVSALNRLLERHADLLLPDQYGAALEPEQRAAAMALTSMPPPPTEPADPSEPPTLTIHPLDVGTAIEIADGIPQRYPFWASNFFVSPVPTLAVVPALLRRSCLSHSTVNHPEILVCSHSSTPRRIVEIRSGVACAAPAGGHKRLAPMPPATKLLLDSLGKPGREEQHLVPDDAERTANQERASAVSPAIERICALLEGSWPNARFRYPLQDDHRHEEQGMDIRAELAGALRPLGFAQSSRGFRKRTASGHELFVHYDRGPLGGITQASLALRGATWAHSTALWAHPKSKKLRIRSPQTARRYAENIAAAVAHAITLWAEPIEALYGSSDEWLPQSRS